VARGTPRRVPPVRAASALHRVSGRRFGWGWGLALRTGLVLFVVVQCLASAASAGPRPAVRAAVASVAPESAEADETIKEVLLSLDASYVEKRPLETYARSALDALAAMDRCLQRVDEASAITLRCGPNALTAAWPPARAIDVAKLLTNAARLVDPERRVRPARVVAICRAFARATDDPFTAYLSPQSMAKAASQKSGMNAATPGIDLWPRDPSKVREVRMGSGAAAANIVPGDRILSIDGLDVDELTFPEVLQGMSGPNGSIARLRVQPGVGGPVVDKMVARLLVPEDDVRWTRLRGGSTLYIHIPVFKAGVADQVRSALGAGAYTGVVLDLRHNPGGLLPEGIGVLDTFLRDGAMAGVRSGPGRPTDDFVARKDGFDTTVPLVVLIDGGSASASELTAMVLKDRGRATVLGATSAGKGSVQRQIPTPDGGLLKVTAGYYVGPTGLRLDEGGVRPHRFLAPSPRRTALEGAPPGEDSWVLSALDALQLHERNALLAPAPQVPQVGPQP
jgi:carboxyl-terminal processing protease